MSYPLTTQMARAYQEALLEDARQDRWTRVAKARRPWIWERWALRLGDRLIYAGLRLRERYTPAMCSAPDVCQPVAPNPSV